MSTSDPKTERDMALTIFQGRLGYYFSNSDNLDRALTHSSKGIENYERLEFLGDRVLGLVIAEAVSCPRVQGPAILLLPLLPSLLD
jgi:dsRNA-specific ribonuclease